MSAQLLKRIVCFHSDVDFGVTTHLDDWLMKLELLAPVLARLRLKVGS